jgi:hypothetical protein
MFLDADGRKLMKHIGPRTPQGFEDTLERVQVFQDLTAKAEAGDAQAATELLILQLQLEWFEFEEAQMRAEALEEVSKEQGQEIAQLLVDTEVRSLAMAAGRDEVKRREAGEHFLAMWQDERIPATDAQLYSFWSLMADYAEGERDKKLFKKIVGECDDSLGRNQRYKRALKQLEERLKNFPKK